MHGVYVQKEFKFVKVLRSFELHFKFLEPGTTMTLVAKMPKHPTIPFVFDVFFHVELDDRSGDLELAEPGSLLIVASTTD